jgi:hypothetical protein
MRSTRMWFGLILATVLVLAPIAASQGATKPATTPTTKAKTLPAKTSTAPAATPSIAGGLLLSPGTLAISTSSATTFSVGITSTAPAAPRHTFPFDAYVKTDEGSVYVRSGPGLYYYPLTQLAKDSPLTVVGESGDWLAVTPPPSVFGLVRKADVNVSADGKTASVEADAVRIYAGSDTAKRQWCVMASVGKGDTLKVLGLAEDDFLKVVPPTLARTFIAASFVGEGSSPSGSPIHVIEPIKIEIDPLIEEIRKVDTAIMAETQKPISKQDYAAITASLKEIAGKTDKDYLKKAIEERQAFISSVANQQRDYEKALQIQRQLEKRLADIRAEEAAKIAAAEKDKKFVRVEFLGVGVIQPIASLASVDYPIKYKLVDRDGKEILVLKSTTYDLSKYVGKVVGVRGQKTFMPEWRLYCVTVDDLEVLE